MFSIVSNKHSRLQRAKRIVIHICDAHLIWFGIVMWHANDMRVMLINTISTFAQKMITSAKALLQYVRAHKKVRFWKRKAASVSDLESQVNRRAVRNGDLVGDPCFKIQKCEPGQNMTQTKIKKMWVVTFTWLLGLPLRFVVCRHWCYVWHVVRGRLKRSSCAVISVM